MKQFVVVRVGDYLDMRIPNWTGENVHRFAYWQFQTESSRGSEMPRNHDVYYADSLLAAQHLARQLAQNNPGNRYMVCNGTNVYECKAAPPIASRWTDAGLLPG